MGLMRQEAGILALAWHGKKSATRGDGPDLFAERVEAVLSSGF